MMKRIVLCADDYGQAPAISEAIISLLNQQRLSATSCMVNTPFWVQHAKWLVPFRGQINIGLHFNLTHGEALSPAYLNRYDKDFKSLGQALQMAFLKQWDVEVLKEECLAQIKAFEQEMGFLPEFIDGHQHIHQFPRIREALVAAYKVAYSKSDQRAYVRFVQQIKPISVKSLPKLLIIYSSSKAFKKLLDTNHIPHNHAFSGIYPFSESLSYPNWFPKFLTEIQGEGLIMCHPGLDMGEDRDRSDPIAKARTYEYAYLASDQFNIDCKQQSAVLTRF